MDLELLIAAPLVTIGLVLGLTAVAAHLLFARRHPTRAELAPKEPDVDLTDASRKVSETAAPPASRQTEHRMSLVAQLLYAQVGPDCMLLDAVVLHVSSEADLPEGALLSVRLARPKHDMLGAASEALVELWAENGEVVELQLRARGDDVRAQLSNGSSKVMLDLAEAAGLP